MPNHDFILQSQMYLPEFDKVWGWFLSPSSLKHKRFSSGGTPAWCWWGHLGKTINVSLVTTSRARHTSTIKEKNGYQDISMDKLIEMWPDFHEALELRMIAESLSRS